MLADPALIVVDFQKDFAKPGFAMGDDVGHMQAALDATAAFLERYRDSGRTPILIQTVHDDHVDAATWIEKYETQDRTRPCLRGTEGEEFVPELDRRDDDVVVTKHRYNAFHNTPLHTYLTANGITEVLVCGVATNVCVESTVRGAYDRNYDVTVLADCTTSTDMAMHEVSLENMDRFFGNVATSEEVELPPLAERPPA